MKINAAAAADDDDTLLLLLHLAPYHKGYRGHGSTDLHIHVLSSR
jgi:hypothetical protein